MLNVDYDIILSEEFSYYYTQFLKNQREKAFPEQRCLSCVRCTTYHCQCLYLLFFIPLGLKETTLPLFIKNKHIYLLLTQTPSNFKESYIYYPSLHK